jgi:uncharacterized tellurite resistance protein B-like protein
MTTAFVSTTPEELANEYTEKVSQIHSAMMEKIKEAQEQGRFDQLEELSLQTQQILDGLAGDYQERLSSLGSSMLSTASIYNQDQCAIDLDATVYDGDRDYVIEFNQDPNIQKALNEANADGNVFQSRKHLLKSSLRLTPSLAPLLYEIGSKCKEALGLKASIEFYVYQSDRFNASCYPPDENRLYIILTSNVLEKFKPDELTFVVGHEIGHALFNHFLFPASKIMETGADYLSPLHAMKLFAWNRNAEISADRIGLLCCQSYDAAARTFFKLSSGVTTNSLDFKVNEYLQQFLDLEDILSNSELDPEDWYSSHPFSPLRIKALELFRQSETYFRLLNQSGGDITEEEMEDKIKSILSLMEPTYLNEESETSTLIQEFMFLAGYFITLADGQILDSELQALSSLVSPELFADCMQTTQGKDSDAIRLDIQNRGERLNTFISPIQKLNILRDLSIISYADGEIDETEVAVLYGLANLLCIRPEFIDQILNDAENME